MKFTRFRRIIAKLRVGKLITSGKLELEKFEKAEKILRKHLEKDPYDEDAVEILAIVLAAMARHREAIRVLDEGMERIGRTVDLLMRKALILSDIGEEEEARKLVKEAYSKNPDDPTVVAVLVSFIEDEDLEKASIILKKALEKHPDNLDLLTKKAKILLETGRIGEAEEILKKVLKSGGNVSALYNMAKIHYDRKEMRKALKLIEEALYRAPYASYLWYMRGRILSRFRRFKEALECAERAIMLKPNYTSAWILKADMLFVLRRFDEALEAVNRALQLEPENISALESKGMILELMGKYDEAKAVYKKALSIAPNDPSISKVLAIFYKDRGKYDKALEYIERAEALGEGEYNPDFWLAKGKIMEAVGRYREAIECYERGLALAGEDEGYIRHFTKAIKRLKGKK